MNTPPENDFKELRRLLSLKRHEQPPPGYFHRFSTEVIASLKAERVASRRSHRGESAPRWIGNLLEMLQARPAFAGAVATGLCALAIGGIVLYESDSQKPAPLPSLLTEVTPVALPVASQSSAPVSPVAFQPVTAEMGTPLLMASNQLQATPTLFDSVPGLETVPVGYR
jgi:hypothetical protein